MSKPFPRLCKDCMYSKSRGGSLQCFNLYVNADDPSFLSQDGMLEGTPCYAVRSRGWAEECGKRGSLWKAKESTS